MPPTWNPVDYQHHSAAQQTWARELIAKLGLKGTETVLDIGCGDGKVTAEIAAHVPQGHVVGVDRSKEMVEFAQKTFPPASHPNLRFQVMDASHLTFAEEFDVVFSNATLHWILDHRPVLQGIYRALKPGGRILLQMGGRGNADAILAVLDELMAEEPWEPYFRGMAFPYGFYGAGEYSEWLREAGLESRRVELIPKDMTQPGAEGLAGWLRTTWLLFLERLPVERRDGFVTTLVERYLARYPVDAQGRAHVGMVRLEVDAVKAIR